MTQAIFTVPTTGKYTDSVDGGKYRYTAGQVIPLDWAVRLQMPGAALPAAGPPFNDAQAAYIDEQLAAADHTHATITTANLIANGDFAVAGYAGWFGLFEDEVLANSGSMLRVDSQSTGGAISYDPAGSYVTGMPVEDWGMYLFSSRISIAPDAGAGFPGTAGSVALNLEYLNGVHTYAPTIPITDAVSEPSYIFTVKPGAAFAWPGFGFSGMSADTRFIIDNVIFAKIAKVTM